MTYVLRQISFWNNRAGLSYFCPVHNLVANCARRRRAKLARNFGVDVANGAYPARPPVRFGDFEADINAVELRKQGARVKLQEQPFQVLQILLEHPGEVVSREELRRQIWPADTFVDFEQGLNNAIKRLREALSDSPENPKFIETIPRRGYRFIAKLNQPAKCIRSLAVLPLENLSRDPEQEYFAEGLTEALINTLAKIGELHLVSRTSVMQYKGVRRPLREIAQEFHVEGIVEGTVLRADQRVRISIQLVDARADTHLWAECYDRDLRDILALHSEVAQAVAREIRVKLTAVDEARIAKAPPVDPEAFDAYLKGRYYWNRRPAELGKAIQHFQEAISKDSGYAAAFAGLADCLNSLTAYGIAPTDQGSDKAKRLAQRALEMDNSSAEACTALAFASVYEYDFVTAEKGFERAIQLDSLYAPGHDIFGVYLGWMGRYEESYTEVWRALRLDPLSSIFNTVLAFIYFYGRRYDQTIEQCQKTLELDPTSGGAWAFLGWAQSCRSMHESAIASWRKACELWPGASPVAWLGEAYAAAGRRDEAHKVLKQLQELSKERYVTPYGVARIYAALRETEETFTWLETAYAQRANWMVLLKVDPCFDNLRSDPRFRALMRRMNFQE
jgi:TolB-like protein/Tfp pilus assembly protein PilF